MTNYGIGQVLDPNHFDKIGLNRAIYAIENTSRSMNAFWKNHVRKLGPDFVVKRILESVLVK